MPRKPLVRDLQVVGMFYRDDATKARIREICPSNPAVGFQPEPTNPHDPHACQVWLRIGAGGEWIHAGYIPKTVSPLFLHLFTDPGNFEGSAIVRPPTKGRDPEILVSIDEVTP